MSCSATQNAEKTETTITCETADGEPVSYVVKNGENGLKGDGCKITSDKDGEVEITCGEGEEAVSTTLYKAMCGTKPYDPAEKLCDTRDGQVYKTIEICDDDGENCQTWMAENLNYRYVGVKFREGTSYESDSTSWCYDNDPSNCATYGRLYTWTAAVDSVAIYEKYGEECGNIKSCTRFSASALATAPVRGVCPSGWHLPSIDEWEALYTNVGGTDYAGQKLKANTSLWNSNTGTDEYGFSVLPAGSRDYSGDFLGRGNYAVFWSSTQVEYYRGNAWRRSFDYRRGDCVFQNCSSQILGFSVRCLKD